MGLMGVIFQIRGLIYGIAIVYGGGRALTIFIGSTS